MGLKVEKDFLAILRRFGHDVYLQKVTNPAQDNEEPVYSSKLEKWTVYSTFPVGSGGAARTIDESAEGWTSNIDMVFYFQSEANPTSGDRIYEEMNRAPNKQALYLIDFAIPMRGVGGKIVFWEVGTTRIQPT